MKTLNVVAAVIRRGDAVLATARGYGVYKGRWEFPGGKIEPGETPRQALVREIREELGVEIEVGEPVGVIEHEEAAFRLTLHCFWCSIISGRPELREAQDAAWLTRDTLRSVDWLPADCKALGQVEKQLPGE